jgi:hypothetical protein
MPRRSSKPKSEQADDLIIPTDKTSTDFVLGIVKRGEAQQAQPDGSLGPGVTHEIVGKTESGLPILRRRRFSLF